MKVLALVLAALAATTAGDVTIRAMTISEPGPYNRHDAALSGTVASGKADETVGVMYRPCGERYWSLVGGTRTTEGGSWFYLYKFFRAPGSFRARWNGRYSEAVLVRLPITVWLSRRGRTVEARVTTDLLTSQDLTGRPVELQRRAGRSWIRVGWARLRKEGSGFTAAFTVRTRGLTLRAVVPPATAAPCFGRGVSQPLRS